jgi:hypothetical protein
VFWWNCPVWPRAGRIQDQGRCLETGPGLASQRISEATGLGKTDVINRALQVYALVEDLLDKGKGCLTVVNADGERERIYIV